MNGLGGGKHIGAKMRVAPVRRGTFQNLGSMDNLGRTTNKEVSAGPTAAKKAEQKTHTPTQTSVYSKKTKLKNLSSKFP